MNYLDFVERMFIYANTAHGLFCIDIPLDDATLAQQYIKLHACPFDLDIPSSVIVGKFDMLNCAAKAFSLDMQIQDEYGISSAESCPVVAIDIENVTNDINISYNIIGCNAKAIECTDQLQKLDSIIQAAAAKVIALAQTTILENTVSDMDLSKAIAKDTNLSASLERLVSDLDMSIGQIGVQDFAVGLPLLVDTSLSAYAFEAALIVLSVASKIDVYIGAINAKVNETDLIITDQLKVDIVMQAIRYMRIRDYYDITIGTMSGYTLSELSIKIR